MKIIKLFLTILVITVCSILSFESFGVENGLIGPVVEAGCYNGTLEYESAGFYQEDDSLKRFSAPVNIDTSFVNQNSNLPLPGVVKEKVEYDPITNQYIVTQTIGNSFFSNPKYLTLSEYLDYELEKSTYEFWEEKSSEDSGTGLNLKSFLPELPVPSEMFNRLFGGNTIDIRPEGRINMNFGGNWSSTERPDVAEDLRNNGNFDFNLDIDMNMVGQIGDKMRLDFNYNTLSNFNFESNKIKLEYAGTEDEIVQKIEAGNVSMPLPTLLIPGTQTLFGIKSELKFGRLTVTSIASQQKSENKTLVIEGGAQIQEFEAKVSEYEENQHFFLGHEFRERFNKSLANLPYINSSVKILNEDVEVWVTNDQGSVRDIRNVVALVDLGEKEPGNENILPLPNEANFPALDNRTNDLYTKVYAEPEARDLTQVSNTLNDLNLTEGTDFIVTYARKLKPSEYTVNGELGFISLNIRIQPDQIVGVSYKYADNSRPGANFQVGEFASRTPINPDKPNILFVKLLKGITQSPDSPLWDLMMKNVYSLGAYQLEREDFKLDLHFQDPGGGEKRYLPSDDKGVNRKPIINLVNLDNLNANNERDICDLLDEDGNPIKDDKGNTLKEITGDGIFDYIEGVTINSQRGRLMFPVLEPFGEDLKARFDDGTEASIYTYPELYDSTKVVSLQSPEKDRFVIRGTYKSKLSSNIRLNAFDLPPGSITISQGGNILEENVDYLVNYSLGTVQILNDSYIQSGVPIRINYENPTIFGFNLKSMYGTRLDYWANDNLSFGGTFMHLSERPFTPKVNYGNDPISNSMFGLDMNYSADAPGITKFIDKIPFIDTKEKSDITFRAEAARFAPGHSKAITKEGQVFIDDFEGSTSSYDISFPFNDWKLSSTPTGAKDDRNNPLFPEAALSDNLEYGENRALINWYQIENPAFCNSRNALPGYGDFCSLDENRLIPFEEVFPARDIPQGQPRLMRTFDISYYPNERGPYNFTTDLNDDGTLKEPKEKWGGIMRSLDNSTDFEASNTEFIEFWVMDPLINDPTNSGSLYINLGEISEDILKDGNKFGEHTIDINPGTAIDTTNWGIIPQNQISPSFSLSTNEEERLLQDVGLDGASDTEEQELFADYLNTIENSNLQLDVKESILNDPSNDNYAHFRDDEVQGNMSRILNTYKRFNNPEGNSPVNMENNSFRTTYPYSDREDLNNDNTLNRTESYFEYKIDFHANMKEGDRYLARVLESEVRGQDRTVKWYNFRIPIEDYTNKVGPISNFRSIRFVRMFLTDFENPVTCRFEGVDLIRNQWRKYKYSLKEPGEGYINDDGQDAYFNVTSVGFEEDSRRNPIHYTLPPNLIREEILSSFGTTVRQNEQSMALQTCGLEDGDAKAVFKTLDYDFREFKRMKLVLHAEQALNSTNTVKDGDVTAFIRIGSDFTNNYYEYEIPLAMTEWNVPQDTSSIKKIWPDVNAINFSLDTLVKVKRNRNVENWQFNRRFTQRKFIRMSLDINPSTGAKDSLFANISVVGSPDLGKVKTVMLGIRNPEKDNKYNPLNFVEGKKDDEMDKCVEVWYNEFALSEFDESDGYAAIATLDMKLADWGNLVLSGNMHTDGFGTLEQKVNERYKDTYYEYDGALNLELGKFFPKESGIKIPFRADYTKSISDPEFDPYETDIRFDDSVDDEYEKVYMQTFTDVKEELIDQGIDEQSAEQEAIRRGELKAEDAKKKRRKDGKTVDEIKSLNFVGVRKIKTNSEKKQRIYDIENWTASYAYREENYRDPFVEYEDSKEHNGSLGYNYSLSPKYITPFKKLIKSDSKWLALVKDFNFNPLPNSINFSTDVRRRFEESKLRNLNDDSDFRPTYNKNFTWGRNYGFTYDLAKSLNLSYNATNLAEIDEPCGPIDTQMKKDSLRNSIRSLGRNIDFRQGVDVRYKLPFDKLPLTDWLDVQVRYGTNFDWSVSPFANVDTIQLGNVINNAQNITINGKVKMRDLYNKSEFLKQYDTSGRPVKKKPKRKKKGKEDDTLADKETEEKPEKVALGSNKAMAAILKPLMSIKQVSLDYRETNNTSVPGFLPSPQYIGQNWDMNAPGLDFVFGRQPELNSWLGDVSRRGWITPDTTLNYQVLQNKNQTIDATATLEPFNDFKIDISASMKFTKNHSEWFKKVDNSSDFQHINPIDIGSYTVSYIPIRTLFKKVDPEGERISEVFKTFENNRTIIGDRLAAAGFSNGEPFESPSDSINGENYYKGYGPYAQDILIPAFMAAYTGTDARTAKLNPLSFIPLPNWGFRYNGLKKLGNLKEYITDFTIQHSYKASYTVNNYKTDPFFDGNRINENVFFQNGNFMRRTFGYGSVLDTLSGNYYSLYEIPALQLTETFAPLIGLKMSFKNDLSINLDYMKSRTLALGFTDYQLLETRSDAITFGLAYRISDLSIPIKLMGRSFTLDNEFSFIFDFTYRDDITINYTVGQENTEPTQGARTYRISPTLEYVVNDRLSTSLYYDHTFTDPHIPDGYTNKNTQAGLRLTFSLAE